MVSKTFLLNVKGKGIRIEIVFQFTNITNSFDNISEIQHFGHSMCTCNGCTGASHIIPSSNEWQKSLELHASFHQRASQSRTSNYLHY